MHPSPGAERGVLCLLLSASLLFSSCATTPSGERIYPQWAKDLRRADIVLFGAFPFAWFFSVTGVDIYRASQHEWDSHYRPWPLKTTGGEDMTTDEYKLTFLLAGSLSAAVALADYLLIRVKREKAVRRAHNAPAEPVIIRTPLRTRETPPPEEETESGSGEAASPEADEEGNTADHAAGSE